MRGLVERGGGRFTGLRSPKVLGQMGWCRDSGFSITHPLVGDLSQITYRRGEVSSDETEEWSNGWDGGAGQSVTELIRLGLKFKVPPYGAIRG